MKERTGVLKFFKYVLIYLLLIVFLMPFYLMVINSFKTTQEFVSNPFSLPDAKK